jgi:hypothetical protein
VYSVVLSDPKGPKVDGLVVIDTDTINVIKEGIKIWKKNIGSFAGEYVESDRKEIEFFTDIVLLCLSLSKLPSNYLELLKFRDAGSLMHNRIMAQIIADYYDPAIKMSITPQKNNAKKIHDFNIGPIKCEIKTIQSMGVHERAMGGHRFTNTSYKSLVSAIRDDMDDAKKVGSDGMVFISSWSYKINSILSAYFKNKLTLTLPIPTPGLITLIMPSGHVSQDYYVTFPTSQFLSIIESVLTLIQTNGVAPIEMFLIREGLVHEAMTAAIPNSSAGYFFK